MNFNAITITDIARELKLSVSTVSKALRDSHEIGAKTKQLVNDYAREHNYQPNTIAQSLRKGSSRSIGIIVSTIENQFFSQVINGIESVAYREGYNVIITQTHESYELEVKNLEHLTHRSIDGLLISLSTETKDISHLHRLHDKGLPIVFFDRVSNDINTHKVIADNVQGGYEATKHLLASGYKKIAHMTSSPNISITKERFAGYEKALAEAGITINKNYVKHCAHGGKDLAEIENALNELLNMADKPEAVFTASDRITTTTFMLLNKMKVNIPLQMAMVGFSNTNLADVLNPSLSTVSQPGFEIGVKATEMLLSIIKSKQRGKEFETLVLPTQLINRDSSAPKNI